VRVSGTQIWIGRNPRARNLLRWARTFSREDRRFGADRRFELEAMGQLPEWLHVTYPKTRRSATSGDGSFFGTVVIIDHKSEAALRPLVHRAMIFAT
jgi:hypothetical protein